MTIRRIPEDFRVVERLQGGFVAGISPEPLAYALYRVTKTSLTTPEAARRLGAAVGVAGSQVAYAGLKDKHAVTVQHMTLPGPADAPAAVAGPGWEGVRVGWCSAAIDAGAIAANAFLIVVRGLGRPEMRSMVQGADRLRTPDDPGTLRVINYFGEQRFGSARHGQGFAAPHLIRGEFDAALRLLIGTPARKDSGAKRAFTRACAGAWGDWARLNQELPRCPEKAAIEVLAGGGSAREAFLALPNLLQVFAVEAFQSALWNEVAARLAATIPDHHAAEEDPGMIFPHAGALPASWDGLEVPTVGPGLVPVEPWGGHARAVLGHWGLEADSLRIPGVRRPGFGVVGRPLVARATLFAGREPEPDDLGSPGRWKTTVTFELPRGAYATVVLRALGQ